MTLSDQDIPVLYAWIDELPLSRPKRNIARDFSDAVLVAEIFKHFFPKMVDLHNYPAANSVAQKLYNWNTLNQKIFRKIGLTFSNDLISNIAYAKAGFIEELLFDVKQKIEEIQQSFQHQDQFNQQNSTNQSRLDSNVPLPHSFDMGFQEQQPPQTWQPMANQQFTGMPSYGYQDHHQQQQQQQQQHPLILQQAANQLMHPMNAYDIPQSSQVPYYNAFPSAPASQPQSQPPVPTIRSGKSKSKKPSIGQSSKPAEELSKALHNDTYSKPQEKDQIISDLQETIEILQLKVSKLEKLIELKDRKIQELVPNPSTRRK